MQVAVQRDAQGRSNYGMCAVNPIRVSQTFNEKALKFVVEAIARQSNDLLEIVNYNVENFQYVVAGELTNLETLRLVLNKIRGLNLNFIELAKTKTIDEIEEVLAGFVEEGLAGAKKKRAASNGFLTQERGVATIPLPGIDVPFHSSFLLNGVGPFREILRKKLEPRFINVNLLVGKYIPNLTAEPFSLSKAYIENVYNLTDCPMLKQVLDEWSESYATPTQQQQIGYLLLLALLSAQFAKSVRWIETMDVLFGEFHVERLIEVGPAPVLSGMAARTLKIKYEAYDDAVTHRRVQFSSAKNRTDIYYEFKDEVPEDVGEESQVAPAETKPVAAISAPDAAAPVARSVEPIA